MPRIGRKSDGVRRAAAPERRKRGAETVEGRKMGANGPEKREKRALATLFRKKNDDY